MTEFPICRLKTRPQFDTLPVMKVTRYPLEPRDYKPFAQGMLAVDLQRLYVRLWAFETPPEPESRILCVLRGQQELVVEAAPEGVQPGRAAAGPLLHRRGSAGAVLGLAG